MIWLDAESPVEVRADPATSIEFPRTIVVQSKTPLPPFQLVGLGVRTVSFLGIKVYSVAFYADLANPRLNIPIDAPPEEKINHLVRNTACMLRIVPTRNTSFTHLRDGFIRALQGRIASLKQRNQITLEEELNAGSPIRKLKSLFPNSPLKKGEPLDIILTAPPDEDEKRRYQRLTGKEPARSLIVRDLGAIQDDWVSTEFVMAYFEGEGLSPALRKDVIEGVSNFGRK
ncbi:hypothetical protein PUNSTDRAFT_129311 [Punctularia strigosozonata HHB-11173 SS5]|uniref:uncharacterized protein n=1 Tax=Punctularia strigosozonata (strain HHB-11173) TaxID=741275 RepID=UPI0004418723|nr:uncharacterized protein PUNSTDRAFT_129311 [Punctularia strigosozonata HHB-11173 SS5]EIN13636.1 hypothetical protein PUNSTDRAFT_129311 [Punctularia strigosozonata HHB-11173 SS5]